MSGEPGRDGGCRQWKDSPNLSRWWAEFGVSSWFRRVDDVVQ